MELTITVQKTLEELKALLKKVSRHSAWCYLAGYRKALLDLNVESEDLDGAVNLINNVMEELGL